MNDESDTASGVARARATYEAAALRHHKAVLLVEAAQLERDRCVVERRVAYAALVAAERIEDDARDKANDEMRMTCG
jgi:hypothetical protein